MLLFFKSQLSSFIATVVDFLVTVVAVEIFCVEYVHATVLGACCGALVNFILGRIWVFQAQSGRMKAQLVLYLLVWLGSLLLNALGMYLFTDHVGLPYIVSKIITAVLVGVFYNYSLQRSVVFKSI
jgi:putative flippase GtrA